MSIQAQTPDGVIHQFPDGTPDAAVDKAIKDYLSTSAPSENVFQKAGRLIGENYRAGTDAYKADVQDALKPRPFFEALADDVSGKGLIRAAKPVADALSATVGAVTKGVADATFGDKAAHLPAKVGNLDIPQWAQNINSKGLTGGDIATFAIPAAGELNGLRTVGKAANAAGVTSRTMQNTLAASRGVTAAPVAPSADSLAATVQQFDQAGVRPSLAVTGDGASKWANTIAENALAGGSARANMAGQVQDVQQQAQRIGKGYGAAADRPATGEAVQQGIKDFNQRFSDRAEALYDKAFAPINEAHDAAVSQIKQDYSLAKVQTSDEAQNAQAARDLDYRNRLAQAAHGQTQAQIDAQTASDVRAARAAQRGGPAPAVPEDYVYPADKVAAPDAPTKAAVIQPNATADTLGKINARGDSPALKDLFTTPQVQKLTAAIKDPASLSFQDLRDARTWVRNAQRDDTLRQGVSQSDLQRIEGALTQDINTNAANLAGPKAARQLQQADQFYRIGSQRIQGALQAFVGKNDGATAESAYDRIVRAAGDKGGADAARLAALKKSLQPSEWGDVAASVINRMGAPSKGAANANEADAFSLANFVSNYANLSERGKAMLFSGGDKGQNLKAELDNLVAVAGKVKAVEKGANASKSGVSLQNAGTLTSLGGAATAAAMGHVAPLVLELGGLGAMNITGRVLTDPAAVRWLVRLRSAERASPAALSSTVGRLGASAKVTPALVPLYLESQKLLQAPARAAAETTNPPAETQ